MAANKKPDPTLDDLLDKLGSVAIEREQDSQKPFPPTWDPSDPDHPNPLVMAAFPQIVKPRNATSPLIRATHRDGREFTVWLNNNLAQALLRADTRTGEPCSIRRSSSKHRYYHEELGREVEAWSWFAVTSRSLDAPPGGGQVVSIEQLGRIARGEPERVELAQAELVPDPDPYATEATGTGDDIPF